MAVTVWLCAALATAAAGLAWLYLSLRRAVSALAVAAERLAGGERGVAVSPREARGCGRLAAALATLGAAADRTVSELRHDHEQLVSIVNNIVEAVVAVDPEGRVYDVNPALCGLFGIEREKAWDRPFVTLLRHARLIELLDLVIKEGRPRVDEVVLFTPEERVFETHAVPLVKESQRLGAMLVLHDITRIRRLERVRREFVANVSHELRTPLASIRGYAETLREGALDDRKHRLEFVEAIESDAQRLTRLVDDLLDLSAIESGHRPPKLEAVSALEIARETANRLRSLAARRSVTLDVAEPASAPDARADRAQLAQVFTNLLDNAIKFNREGGRVTVSAQRAGDRLAIAVEDTGPGIPSEDLPRLFERFYRVEKARSRELGGTGLGLSIVKHIVEAHGGSVTVESAPDRGSTFRFTLPLA